MQVGVVQCLPALPANELAKLVKEWTHHVERASLRTSKTFVANNATQVEGHPVKLHQG